MEIIMKSSQVDMVPQAIRCDFQVTNNEAEYEGLIDGLQLFKDIRIINIHVYVDSMLLANHFYASFAAKSEI